MELRFDFESHRQPPTCFILKKAGCPIFAS